MSLSPLGAEFMKDTPMTDEVEFAQTKLNKALCGFGVLKPKSRRYKFVQALGYVLWGRKLGYLSWWPRAGRSAGVLLCNSGKILLGRRRNMHDGNGKYSWPAGFINRGETSAQGLSREIWEETRLKIPAEVFNVNTLFFIRERFGNIAEMHDSDTISLSYYYHLPDDQLQHIQETNEMHDFRWVDEAELDQMHQNGELAFESEYAAIKHGFKLGLVHK